MKKSTIFTERQDRLILEAQGRGRLKDLAGVFNLPYAVVATRRRTLLQRSLQSRSMILRAPNGEKVKTAGVFARPSWFEDERLDFMSMGRR